MFRLPLRTSEQAARSEVSRIVATEEIMTLLKKFEEEAKKLLLFLNHVKEIGLWEIDENSELKLTYSVSSKLKPKSEKKLHELHGHLQDHKNLKTHEILIKDTTYSIHIQDTERLQEKWLIHQIFGIREEAMSDEQTPNVCDLGLFPRGGIAALLSTTNRPDLEKYVAYCFLPLPVTTSLPVHVNGHFALDGSRRDLWWDQSKTCRKTNWNGFMKEQVLGPAYASLITKIRKHIPYCERESEKIFFSNEDEAIKALVWYHKLFPDPEKDPDWNTLAVAVYKSLKEAQIFPVVSQSRGVNTAKKHQSDECGSEKSSGTREGRRENSVLIGGRYRNVSGKHAPRLSRHREKGRRYNSKNVKMARYAFVAQKRCEIVTKFSIEWLPPNLVYFTEEKKRIEQQALLLTALLEIRMPVLLYTPMRIYKALKKSEVTTNLLSPENVIDFLLKSQDESSRCVIGKLPIQLRQSNIQNESNLRSIFEYCKTKLEELPSNLEGLPLLLTADNMLRLFTANSPVYCTEFIDLFPDKASRFVHLQFVPLLLSFCEVDEAELGIIRHLTITSLAEEFMPDVFRDKLPLGETKHVPWSYPENGVLSKEWFSILWKFLETVKRSEREDTIPLLGKYPIIPTKDGKLATVDNSKSVLATTRFKTKSLNSLQRPVAKILEDLSCPFLDESITEYGLPVVLPLVAHPDSESDVLHVLDYMNSTGILDLSKFDDEKIFTLLKFFQADCGNETSMGKAKTLPFYKGVDGNYYSLLLHSSYIKIPARLPEDGIRELQSIYGTRVLLFPSSLPSELDQLFVALGIEVDCRVSEFYIKYVLPNFSLLSRECQIKFLTCIRGTLRFDLIEELKWTRCIPDQTGNLCFASRYLNPHNELFQAMFKTDADVFPASPFNEVKWLEFLLQIGMKEKCDQEQFIEFANNVEQSAQKLTEYDENIIAQSKALVKYLLGNERDGAWSFYGIPEIKFIVPKEIEEELSSIHPQHRADGILEFVSYRDSVPWDLRHLIWTSYKLLPDWAFPRHNESLISALGITSEPPLNAVFQHIETMSNCASKIIVSNSTLSEKLKEVFKTTYEFLVNLMKHCAKEPSSDCNEKCQKIGECLTSVACILLNEERCLVRGEKLSIEDTKDKLKPHFYKIPRDYAPFDHLLKRLGATEKISASQMASVLKSIKDSSTDEKMSSEEEEKACFATSVLFKSLLDDKETEADSRLANCEELLLPSMAKRLISSDKLVCKMQPRLHESVAKQGYEILIPFEKCGMKRELENDYLQALPKHLRPTPLSELVREELHPWCKKNMSCTLCLAMDYHSFIQRFILLLRSSQFERGIIRLLKHQKELTELDEKDRERAARFTSAKLTTIKCMQQVQIHLVNVLKEEPLPGSSVDRSCHVEKEENSWTLYIQHEFGGRKNHAIFAKAVNEIMDRCLEQTAELSDMLSCDSPSQIPGVLNDHDVAIDYNEENEQFGLPVPDVYHYLIIQKPLCNYEEGARVAYDEDEGCAGNWKESELKETSIRYKFVKINSRANAIDEDANEFDFKAQYKIDLGSKTDYKIVSVLDLYSYKQNEMGSLVPDDEDDEEVKVDVLVEKSKITRALKLAKNNLESLTQRKKVIRRLFLHWLRWKDSETADVITKFIENEVTRLKILCLEETRAFSSYWRSYGRRERTTYRSYNRWTSVCGSLGGYYDSGSHGGHYDPWDYVSPDAKEAERWIKQSQADLNVATWLLDKSFSQVCYMSQQCVEKVLKGVLYAKCGIPRVELRTHHIYRLVNVCRGLDGAPSEALDRASSVGGYYLPTRYPDNQPQYRVPAEEYTEEQAKEALDVAVTIFAVLEKFAFN